MSPTIDCSWVGAGPKIHDYLFVIAVPDLRIFVLVRSVVSIFLRWWGGGGECAPYIALCQGKTNFQQKQKGF